MSEDQKKKEFDAVYKKHVEYLRAQTNMRHIFIMMLISMKICIAHLINNKQMSKLAVLGHLTSIACKSCEDEANRKAKRDAENQEPPEEDKKGGKSFIDKVLKTIGKGTVVKWVLDTWTDLF